MADQQVIVDIKTRLDNLENGMKKAQKKVDDSVKKMRMGFLKFAGVVTMVTGLVVKLTKAFAAQEQAEAKLASNLKLVTENAKEQRSAFDKLTQQERICRILQYFPKRRLSTLKRCLLHSHSHRNN